jgi:nucleoside-diphosphate-sugar epimerase
VTTIALSGATGFVGQATLAHLLARGFHVRALVRPGRQLAGHSLLESVTGSLEEPASLESLVAGCGAVIHVAGAITGADYPALAKVNVGGTRHLIGAMKRHCPDARLVHVSSLAAREPQLSDYAASKRAGEDVVTLSGLDWIILRPPAVYGPRDPALAPLWRWLARGWLLRPGAPEARFSLLHVDDLATALIAAAATQQREPALTCLHDGRPDGYDWADLVAIAEHKLDAAVRVVPIPRSVLAIIANGGLAFARAGLIPTPVLVPGKVRELAHPDWVCDNSTVPGCPDWKPSNRLEDCLGTLPGWTGQP